MNIRELAKEAGVSVATISRVINHPEAVLPETRERVQAIIEKYNYDPKPVNRGRRVVALLVPSAARAQGLLRGVQSVLAPKGILVNLVETAPPSGGTAACIYATAAAKPIGMLIAGEPSLAPEVLPAELPVVLLGSYERLESCNICGINYRDAAEKMVSHLYAMGHRSIWLLQSCGDAPEKAAITAGYRQMMAALGLIDRQCRILEAEDSVAGGYRICREEILTEEPPQAVFAVSDALAMGIIKVAREENISLPEELAVTGFTGSEAAAVITPALTTMEHPLERLGAVAARRLIELIEDSVFYQVETHEIILKSKLKIRRSCGNRKEIYELFE